MRAHRLELCSLHVLATCHPRCDHDYDNVTIIFYDSYESVSQRNDCSLWLEMARDGFMNKVVIEAWTECGQVRTGREILEMKIL